jgi:ribonuclease HI
VSIIVFTDGAAKGNPGPGGWGAIVVTPDRRVTELGGGSAHTTNNRMELSGAIAALQHVANQPGRVAIYTDSTQGGDVLNRELWEQVSSLVGARQQVSTRVDAGAHGDVQWHWVRGHVGTPGNERADQISVAFAQQQPPDLYVGPLDGYALPILQLPDDTTLPKRSAGAGTAAKAKVAAYSYLSVVGGVPMRHVTWADCERRVKGQSGARFKKATNAADEFAILSGWGIDPSRLS